MFLIDLTDQLFKTIVRVYSMDTVQAHMEGTAAVTYRTGETLGHFVIIRYLY